MYQDNIKFLRVALLAKEKAYPPAEVRKIRKHLEMSLEEFGDLFFQSPGAVQAWEAEETSPKHREVSGAAARVMQLVEWVALDKRKGKNDDLQRALNTARLRGITR